MNLTPFQSETIDKITAASGTIGDYGVPVGFGKTMLTILAPLRVPGCKRAVAFVASGVIPSLLKKYEELKSAGMLLPSIVTDRLVHDAIGHIVPGAPVLHIFSEVALSKVDGAQLLPQLKPDVIIIDEWRTNTARHHRLNDYLEMYECDVTVVRWIIPRLEKP